MTGDVLTLEIEKPAAGGRMLARHHGQVVLVWGAIPGEHVTARVDRASKDVLYAETLEVLQPSTDRRAAPADWRCGGSVLAHVSYPRQLTLKGEIIRDAFARIGRIPLESRPHVTGSPEQGYRMRARLHVRGTRVGFVREGTHELCDAGPTGQLLESTIAWISFAQDWLGRERVAGLISLELAENVDASGRVAHLELEPGSDGVRFGGLAGIGLTGLSAQVTDRRAIVQVQGVPTVTDVIHTTPEDPTATLQLQHRARSFFQANRFLLETLAQRVVALVTDGPIVDLYAGVGLFGLSLAAAGRRDVIVVEGDPISGRDLETNAGPYADRVRVVRSSVEEFSRGRPLGADTTVIVDPPRTGMSKEALRNVLKAQAGRIVYVSCDVATLARDARLLVEAGYRLEHLSGLDLFPNTAHVEAICAFDRRGGP